MRRGPRSGRVLVSWEATQYLRASSQASSVLGDMSQPGGSCQDDREPSSAIEAKVHEKDLLVEGREDEHVDGSHAPTLWSERGSATSVGG